jgi:AbiJ N-terminal domain 3/TIR domain
MNGDDDSFLAFLCETIHPLVRPDPTEAERICQLYNKYLRNDGFQIIEKTRLSGKPIFVGRYVGVDKLMQSTAGTRISQKLALIDRIGRTLQSRYTFTDINLYLAEFKISPPKDATQGSKWVYTKEALRDVPLDTVIKIAEDLGLEQDIRAAHGVSTAPRNWQDTNKFRLFISHIAKHKDRATRLRACLTPYAISGFVAHEDIHPTLEWEKEIERALYTMDAFLAIHTPGFKDSFWTQQEIGFAVGRGVKIISFKMGEDPTGFISKHQALPRRGRTAEEIAREVDAILADDPLTAGNLNAAKRSNGVIADDDRDIPF